ncbi:caspase family protein [Streptomyces tricolor]|nr:caspase family protein [Streptomyces tricolor]
MLLSNPARPDTVLEAVSRAARAATDTLLVYFAGHGWLETDNDLCLMLPGSHPDHLIRALKYRDLRSLLLARRRAHSQVVILDSCFSGTAVTGFMGGGFAGGGFADAAQHRRAPRAGRPYVPHDGLRPPGTGLRPTGRALPGLHGRADQNPGARHPRRPGPVADGRGVPTAAGRPGGEATPAPPGQCDQRGPRDRPGPQPRPDTAPTPNDDRSLPSGRPCRPPLVAPAEPMAPHRPSS